MKRIGFKTVQLFKDQTLGIGSYGKVCKAKCNDLLCAAKLIHETLFTSNPTVQLPVVPQKEHRLPIRRFEQECEFLSTIRHPNIVQYLGIYRDPDTSLPALLMELMDGSLTHFLESSPQPIPYHSQVNICHDIALALSFLHSNDILHRDLSSNNVLLIGNVRAKVTDFGMARLGDHNPQTTRLILTTCPGANVYMPPEAVQEEPVYTEKIDCFSFGVIIIQILSQQFPEPSNRKKKVSISNHPDLPSDTVADVPVPEVERRQNHICTIDPNHTLLQVALDCLKDRDVERPSAQQLCERVAAMKQDVQYRESLGIRSTPEEEDGSDERDRELRLLRRQHSEQVQQLQQIIQSQTSCLEEKDQPIMEKEQKLQQNKVTIADLRQQTDLLEMERNHVIIGRKRLEKEKNEIIKQKERELEESQQVVAEFVGQMFELEQLMPPVTDTTSSITKDGKTESKQDQVRPGADISLESEQQENGDWIKMIWREEEKAPCKMNNGFNAAVDGGTLYVRVGIHMVYSYSLSTSTWSKLPDSPTFNCPSVIINHLLTLIGGSYCDGTFTRQLFSLTGVGLCRRWTEEFPPMPTKRSVSTALCTGTALIVAGGQKKDFSVVCTVEVLNTETLQWSTTADLPQSLCRAPGVLCGDLVYILGESAMYMADSPRM